MHIVEQNPEPESSKAAKQFASWWACDVIESESCTLSANAAALLMLLAAHADATYYCTPSVELLARGMRLKVVEGKRTHRAVVQRARAELVAAGLVVVFPGGGRNVPNGYWLSVRGAPPTLTNGRPTTAVTPIKGRSPAAVSYPQRPLTGGRSTTEVIHNGRCGDTQTAAVERPEVDIEVSKERACVFSPALTTKSGRKLLRDGATDWDAT